MKRFNLVEFVWRKVGYGSGEWLAVIYLVEVEAAGSLLVGCKGRLGIVHCNFFGDDGLFFCCFKLLVEPFSVIFFGVVLMA